MYNFQHRSLSAKTILAIGGRMFKTVGDLLEFLYEKGKRRQIIGIESTAPAHEAATSMKNYNINLLVVYERDKPVGVVSSSDTSKEFGSSLRPSERMVSDIMTRKVVTVGINDDLMEVPKVLSNIRHLVVVDSDGVWVAILSSNEVLRGVMENINKEEQMRAYMNAEERRVD